MRRTRSVAAVRFGGVVTAGVLVVLLGACGGATSPAAPDGLAGDGERSAAARPGTVCRGGPAGDPCWTPGERPPTGPQPGPTSITFTFTGVISFVPDPIAGGPFAAGQAVSGSYTFDPTAIDQDPSAAVGRYVNVTAFSVSIPAAGYTGTGSPGVLPGFIEIQDGPEGTRDRYVASMTAPDQILSGTPVPDAILERLAIVLRDSTATAFASDALPLEPPSLAAFGSGTEVFIGFLVPLGNVEMPIGLTSLTMAP